MTQQPFLNALVAALYIVLISSGMYYIGNTDQGPDTIFAPIAVISLFTLSAALMGFIFLSQPLQMYLDGKKKEGVSLFVKSVGIFALFTLLFLFGALIV